MAYPSPVSWSTRPATPQLASLSSTRKSSFNFRFLGFAEGQSVALNAASLALASVVSGSSDTGASLKTSTAVLAANSAIFFVLYVPIHKELTRTVFEKIIMMVV